MPIFDQGYQHWSGALSGHAWRWLAIARHGVRVAMSGEKRGRALRVILLLSSLPALALASVLCLWGLVERRSPLVASFLELLQFLGPTVLADPRAYRTEIWTLAYNYFLATQLMFSMVLVLLVGPNLISQDLRYNALPLYFSRPLRRIDYFFGKLGVIVAFLGMVIVVPSLIAYVLGLLFSLDITIIRDTFRLLLASVVYGLVIAVSAGMLVLALSSLSRNSRYISLLWVGVWVVSGIVAGVLEAAHQQERAQRMWRAQQQIAQQQMIQQQAGQADTDQQQIDQQPAGPPNAADSFLAAEIEAAKTNWRPLVSYTANLSRVGQKLLGTERAWERLAQLQPPGQRSLFLLQNMGSQYPWYWSAAVLAALFALSAWILNRSIKSLDRLR